MPVETAPCTSSVRVPWGAWHDGEMTFEFPEGWSVVALRMADADALAPAEIDQALGSPIDAEPLEILARGRESAAIAVDDITRPTPAALVLPGIIRRLVAAGVPGARISMVIASGAHRRASAADIASKVGTGLARLLRVVPHDCEQDLADTGVELAGVRVRINRTFADADLRIGVGSVMPHPFAAFSGGGKIVIPGLADLDVLARSHKFALMGLHGGDVIEKNRFRLAMEEAVRRIGLHWTANVVVNSRREIASLRAGDFVSAHRAAAADAARIGRTPLPDAPLNALVVNAYPKDRELLQAEAAFVALKGGLLERLEPGAPVVLAASCTDGLGIHHLLGPGGRLFRPPAPRNVLRGRPLIVFAPGVTEAEARAVFCGDDVVTSTWTAALAALKRRLGPAARVGVLPCAPLQVAAEGVPRA